MKRIGEIAAKLVRNPIELVAAANQAPRVIAADLSGEEGTDGPPTLIADAPAPSGSGMGKDGRTTAPKVVRTNPARAVKRGANRYRRTASPASEGRAPVPAVRLYLVAVDGARAGHAALARELLS